jgi:hypothetical protein
MSEQPIAAEYDYTIGKWVVIFQGSGGGGEMELDGPPPEEIEQARREAAEYRKRYGGTPEWWESEFLV